jgi:hypothetical protein
MAGVLARTVFITRDDNTVAQLTAGSEVPKEFAKLLEGHRHVVDAASSVSAPAAGSGEPGEGESGSQGDGYDSLGYPELKALAKKRELPQNGKTADLIKRLRQDDAEQSAAGSGEPGEGESGDDNSGE